METTRLSNKGQVIVPKSVREAHRWHAGQAFEIEDLERYIVLRPINAFLPTCIEDLINWTGFQGQKHTLDDMNAAISKGVAARSAKGAS